MPVEPRYRDRAVALAITDGHVLVIRRVHPTWGEYYVFPGGGVEDGEAPTDAVQRELREETGLHVIAGRKVMTGSTPEGFMHHYFLVTTPMVPVALPQDAEESAPERTKRRGTYEPMWIPVKRIPELNLKPEVVTKKLLECINNGFPDVPVDLGPLYADIRK